MYISRVVIKNFRNFSRLDVKVFHGVTCLIGENNTGKTNFLHALRLALDVNLSSRYRQLIDHDIYSGIDISKPDQVIVSVELCDFENSIGECALVGCCEVEKNKARIHYRFRPRFSIREAIENEEMDGDDLTLDDYHWELTGGGANDPAKVKWNEELGTAIRFNDLQQYKVVYLPALRDVQREIRMTRTSPLGLVLSESDMNQTEKNALVDVLREANRQIAESPPINKAGNAIQKSFSTTAGEAFDMDVKIGMVDPSFGSISSSLNILFSNDSLQDFEPSRNGLGLNNILYISMLLEYFKNRISKAETAGQLLLIEEPEAHLHPQLQRVLYNALDINKAQVILSTHSTHVSSRAPIESCIVLTNKSEPSAAVCNLTEGSLLTDNEASDINRYLDATRSTMLYARKVILVEGPAELFFIPALVKKLMRIDLDSHGVSVVPIFGVHFDCYAKLFGKNGMPKKCAIIADGDLSPDGIPPPGDDEDEAPKLPDLESLENNYVKIFRCKTTFERAITTKGLLPVLQKGAEECGAPIVAKQLGDGYTKLKSGKLNSKEEKTLRENLRNKVLNTAKRFGKARFAQTSSKHMDLAKGSMPKYIKEAINWLIEQ